MPTPAPSIPIDPDLLRLTLKALHRHEDALAHITDRLDRGYPIEASSAILDAITGRKEDRDLRDLLRTVLSVASEPT